MVGVGGLKAVVLRLGRKANTEVLAEGVETVEGQRKETSTNLGTKHPTSNSDTKDER